MEKAGYLKNATQRFRDYCRLSRHYRQTTFVDKFLVPGTKIPFKHEWRVLAHMHDLRVWTLAYAPSRINNLQRMQEIHQLNNEMWYMVSNALWKRVFALFFIWFALNRLGKKRFLNQGNFDSHDA